jgi:hypothetical protein
MLTLMYDFFIMCFVLFLFVTCFGWNFNPIAAAAAATAADATAALVYMAAAAATAADATAALGYMAVAAAALSVFTKSLHYSTCLSSIFFISFHITT